MYNQDNIPARTQLSHYLRTGRILSAEYFADHKSCQSAYGEDDSPSQKSWTTGDFLDHYARGNGRAVDIFNKVPGNQDLPFSKPYKIIANWSETFNRGGQF